MNLRLLVILILLTAGRIFGEDVFHLHGRWRQISSPRFVVVYPAGKEYHAVAEKALAIAEDVHVRYAKKFPHGRRMPTWIILSDNVDDMNGWATTLPIRKIQVYLRHPESTGSFAEYSDHLELVISHEYGHILHLDQKVGIWKIIGVSPNWFLPVWMIEGLAVFMESEYTGRGRLQSSWVEGFYRTDVYGEEYKSLANLTVFPVRWPAGEIPYCYGSDFYAYLARRFGQDKIFALQRRNIFRVPYFHAGLAKKTFGLTFPELYREYQLGMREKYRNQIRSFAEAGTFTEYRPLQPPADARAYLRSHDGRLYYHDRAGSRRPGIRGYDPATGRTRTLVPDAVCKGLSAGPDGLFWAEERTFRGAESFYDLFHARLDGKRKRALTRRARISMPFQPAPGEVWFLQKEAYGRIVLRGMTLPSREIRTVYAPPEGFILLEAAGDKKELWLLMKKEGGFADLYLLESGRLVRVSSNAAVEADLFYDIPGRMLYFASAPDGLQQVFSARREGGAVVFRRHVRIPTAALAPAPSGGRLFFHAWTSSGPVLAEAEPGESLRVSWPVEREPSGERVIPAALSRPFEPLKPMLLSFYPLPLFFEMNDVYIRIGSYFYMNDLFDNFFFTGRLSTYVAGRPARPEYEVILRYRFLVLDFSQTLADQDGFLPSGDDLVPVREKWADSQIMFSRRSRGLSISIGAGVYAWRAAKDAFSWPAFFLKNSPLLYGSAVVSSLKSTRRAVQYEEGFRLTQSLGYSIDGVFWDTSRTVLEHYWHLGRHFVLYGKHDHQALWAGGSADFKATHTASLDIPLGWKESGKGHSIVYHHYNSLTFFGGATRNRYPRDLMVGLFNSSYPLEKRWAGFFGMDVNISRTFFYHSPLKIKAGFLHGPFGSFISLGVENALYSGYHSSRFRTGGAVLAEPLRD